jgi:hypothetical protein
MNKLSFLIFSLIVITLLVFACGEKMKLPTETPVGGNLGDTLYLQINPAWNAENGYDFNNPQAIYFGKDTYLYVADTDNNRILQLDAAGTIYENIPIDNPISISQDELMRLLVVTGDLKVYKIDMGPNGDKQPYIAYDYADYADSALAKDHTFLDSTDMFVSITDVIGNDKTYFVAVNSSDPNISTGKVLWFWGSVSPDSSDTLFDPQFTNAVADTFNNPVVETGNGITTINFPNHIYTYELSGEMHLVVCQDSGSYPVHDMVFQRQVWDITWVFNFTHFPGDVDILEGAMYDHPTGATVDAEGNIYVVDEGDYRSCGGFKFSRSGYLIETFCEPDSVDNTFIKPSSITYDLYGNRKTVFIADAGSNSILRFKLSTDLEP